MNYVIIELANYIMVLLIGIYTLLSFVALKRVENDNRKGIYAVLAIMTFLILSTGMITIYLYELEHPVLEQPTNYILCLFFAQVIVLIFICTLFSLIYTGFSRLALNHMCLMLSVGFIIQTRLSMVDHTLNHAIRQFIIIAISLILFLIIPAVIKHCNFLRKLTYVYGICGAAALGIVLTLGRSVNGSKLSYNVFGLTFQPSEFVKIFFAFFLAGLLYKTYRLGKITLSAILASIFVLTLVASKDLGSALIFYLMFVVVVYTASGRLRYFIGGLIGMGGASFVAYQLFEHVRIRIAIWQDPWTDIDRTGYQLTQSLFAIGTGGWFGMGLGRGTPETIPFVDEDFVFSAISEEMGVVFGLLLIMVLLNVVLLYLYTGMRIHDRFYRLVAVGLSVSFATQIILTIGGGTRLIPLTGVTLPLISNGGSSVMATIILFAVMQGIYMLRYEELEGGHTTVEEES